MKILFQPPKKVFIQPMLNFVHRLEAHYLTWNPSLLKKNVKFCMYVCIIKLM